MNRPSIELGTKVSHPSVAYSLEVFSYHYSYDNSQVGQKPVLTYSDQVRCMGVDEEGIEYKHYLFPISELTLL